MTARGTLLAAAAWLVVGTATVLAAEPAAGFKVGIKDSLDGKFDLSDRVTEANGFVPIPIIITEPALGDFGGGLAAVFLDKRPPLVTDGETRLVPPDITAVAGGYTANDSWFAGGGRAATLVKHRLRYRVAAGYADLDVDFYETLPSGTDEAFGFKVRTAPFYLNVGRHLHDPRFIVGGQYFFARSKLRPAQGGLLPDYVTEKELDSDVGTLGVVAEFDSRDNVFTPDRGAKVHVHFEWGDQWTGSDYRYGRLSSYAYWYAPVGHSGSDGRAWTSGLRWDWQQAVGDPPFYLVPFVLMRGIPALRYQGRTDLLLETEQRFDFARRWSGVVFGGVAKAFDETSEFDDAELIYSYGSGFRYLVARKFHLRMGLDVARGPEEWTYYIIFGSAWLR